MVKINISIEGENLPEIVSELAAIGIEVLKTNNKEVKELLRLLADDALDVMLERKILEKGAQLYKKINMEINWTYKKDKQP
ncbi:MAG: hypothetical protein QXS02_01565 [Candidatus Thermoplasmatota archaeon]